MIDRYSRKELRALWSDQRRYDTWLDGRAGRLRGDGARGQRARGHGGARARQRRRASSMPARILEIEERTRHDVIAFLTHVEELAGEPRALAAPRHDLVGRARHARSRSCSCDAADEILGGRRPAARRAAPRAPTSTARRPMIGRSHGIHAEPITAGLVFAGFYAEVAPRPRARLRAARAAIAVGKIAGAVGTYANLDRRRSRRAALGRARACAPETVATQIVARDRHAELLRRAGARSAPRSSASALSVRHWQRTEVGEAEEAFGKGQKGSSAMPHKKNPILSREPDRARAPAARLRRRRRWRTWRCGTSATSRTRRSSA